MSLTAIAFALGFFALIGLAFARHPVFGLYAYLAAFYGDPVRRWWGADLPDLRWSLLASVVTVLACLRLPPPTNRNDWYRTGPGMFLIAYVMWMWLSSAWAVDPVLHREGAVLFSKYALLYFVIYRICDTPERIRGFILAHVIGCFYLGWLAFNATSKGRLEGIGGPGINDANGLGMQLATALACGAVLMLNSRRIGLWIVVVLMPFILNGIVLTASRGAFLNVLGAGFAIWRLQPRFTRWRFYTFSALGVALLLMLGHALFWERIFSIGTAATNIEEADSSASSRTVIAAAQWRMFMDHPMGAGFSSTMSLSRNYLPDAYLTTGPGGVRVRASHNTYMSLLVDQGIVGAILFIALVIWCYRRLRAMKQLPSGPMEDEIATLKTAVGAALMGLAMHALFKNTLKAEVQIWLLALLASLWECARHRLAAQSASQTKASWLGSGGTAATPPGRG